MGGGKGGAPEVGGGGKGAGERGAGGIFRGVHPGIPLSRSKNLPVSSS